MKATATIMSACLLTACSQQPTAEPASVIFHSNPAFEERGYPFSDAVEVGDLVFLSGQVGVTQDTVELVGGGIEPEARQAMENIKSVLERLGLSFKDVVKCTVMIDDMANWPAFNAIYAEYFEGDFPARSAFGADGLALGAAVEVECIAKR
jgi:2-iminobutanoate/2-iminopropanoate deaminase